MTAERKGKNIVYSEKSEPVRITHAMSALGF